jgi:LL-diaminopimelate aminotransferase
MFAGGENVRLPLLERNDYLPDLGAINPADAKRAKILWLNYPNNPTGAIADLNFFERAIEWASMNDVVIAHDLAYADVSFDGYRPPSILEVPGAKDVAIEFNSLSKTFNMTGWRVAMAVGNTQIIDALTRVKTNIDSGIPQAIQEMAITALNDPRDSIESHNLIYEKRRDRALLVLRELGLTVTEPKASLYIWARLPEGVESSAEYAADLIDSVGVVVTPGASYGENGEGYIRISLTTPDDRLDEALIRLQEFDSKR